MIKKLTTLLSLIVGITLVVVSFAVAAVFSYWWITLVIGIIVSAVSIFEINTQIKKNKTTPKPQAEATEVEKVLPEYRRKSTILSRQEMEFYAILSDIISDKFLILPQIALVGVIDKLTQTTYRNELFRMIDFLIADKETFAPKLLIELNDSSHHRADRIERDRRVNEICARAGMPIITVLSTEMRDVPKLKKQIKENMLR